MNDQLADLFNRVKDAEKQVRVSFADGSIYDLQIVSTWHVEAGGDIIANVVRSIVSPCPERWETMAMNFKIGDVVRVEGQGERLFSRYAA